MNIMQRSGCPVQAYTTRRASFLATLLLTQIVGALFIGCLMATLVLIPGVMRFAQWIGAVDRGGYRKVFQGQMPLLGGLGIAIPLALMAVTASIVGHAIVANWTWVAAQYPDHFDLLFAFANSRTDCLVLALGGAGIVVLGIVDDTKGMRARYKLLGQVGVAIFLCLGGFSITNIGLPFVGPLDLGAFLGTLFTVFWVVGLINAFNLIDGVDGLASGIAFVGVSSLVVLGLLQQNAFVTFAGAAMAGCLLGFLFYNFPPARIFLGDTGSMFLGYMLAAMTLIGSQKYETAVILFTPMLALSFPIFETLISILRRYLRGVPVFMGDNHHTHHRLLSKGYSQPRVVLTLYGVATLLAAAAILAAVIPENSPWAFVSYALFAGTLMSIAWLAGYLRPTTFRRIIERRKRNRIYHALAHYANLCLHGGGRSAKVDVLLELCRHELGLLHLELQLENGAILMSSTAVQDETKTDAPRERLRVKSSDDQNIFIFYLFDHAPDENRRHDVNACLAGIFDQLMLDRALKPADKKVPGNEPALTGAESK